MVKIATGYDAINLDLHQHFYQHIPNGLCVPVSDYLPTPYFSPNTTKLFMEAHKKGILKSELIRLIDSGQTPSEKLEFEQLGMRSIRDTIQHFFETELYKPYEHELI